MATVPACWARRGYGTRRRDAGGRGGMNPVARGIGPGLLYGVLAFLCGAVLGPIRELLLAPRIGGLPAALAEGVVLAVALFLAARLAARGLPPGLPWQTRAGMALAGLCIVLLAEAALSATLAATGLAE